jgi:hypothetical protein
MIIRIVLGDQFLISCRTHSAVLLLYCTFLIIIYFLILQGFTFSFADKRVTSISAGGDQTCAVVMSGDILCWGYNINGQLIENSSKVVLRPQVVEIEEGNAA